jgi:branched-chain amino acid transport system substrate-binding protein
MKGGIMMEKKYLRKGLRGSFIGVCITVFIMLCTVLLTASQCIAQQSDQTTGVTSDKIKIGMFAPLTGAIALYGKAAHMAEAIFKNVNKSGGINGRQIEVILEDDACDPIKGVAAVKKLIYQDKVFMLFGGMCTNVCLAAKKDIVATETPYMVLGAAGHSITSPIEKNIFTGVFTSLGVSKAMADFAMSKPNVKRVAIIKHTDEWAKTFYEPVLTHLKEKYNVTPVVDVTIERGAFDATPQILRIKEANPDVVIEIIYVDSTSIFLRDSFKLGLRVPIIGNPGVAVDEQFKRVGIPEAMKMFFAPYWYKYSFDHPEMQKWQGLLKESYPKDDFDMFAGIGIGGTLSVIKALEKSGKDLSRSKFIAALENLNNFQESIIPNFSYPMAVPISFSSIDHIAIDQVAFSVLGKEDKKLKIIYNYKEYMEKYQ